MHNAIIVITREKCRLNHHHRLIHCSLIKRNIYYNCGNVLQIQQQLNSPTVQSASVPFSQLTSFSQKFTFVPTDKVRANSATLNRNIQERFLKRGIIKDQWCCDAMT